MTKRLEEIEARLAAATPGPWEWENGADSLWNQAGTIPVLSIEMDKYGSPDLQSRFEDRELIVHAPADLALLARLVREVVTTRCPDSCDCGCDGEPFEWRECAKPSPDSFLCLPCRIRRELEAAR